MRGYSKALFDFQLRHNVVIRVFRITSEANVRADTLSRASLAASALFDRDDHRLSRTSFGELFTWVEPFTIDAWASPENMKVTRFISRYPNSDPNCVAVGALTYNSKGEYVYVNPPWPPVSALWAHFRQVGARGRWSSQTP
jgi:hypothetical protein